MEDPASATGIDRNKGIGVCGYGIWRRVRLTTQVYLLADGRCAKEALAHHMTGDVIRQEKEGSRPVGGSVSRRQQDSRLHTSAAMIDITQAVHYLPIKVIHQPQFST